MLRFQTVSSPPRMDFLLPLFSFLLPLVALGVVGWLGFRLVRAVERLAETKERPAIEPPGPTDTRETSVAALRLQACERFTLMTERISVPNLLFRHAPAALGAKEYTATLLLSIREEFEYNVTQQIYVSDSLWNVLLQARDNVSQLIVRAAEDAGSAAQVASRLRLMGANQPQDPIALAQAAIRREAVQLVSGQ